MGVTAVSVSWESSLICLLSIKKKCSSHLCYLTDFQTESGYYYCIEASDEIDS